jgi:hypothetical protein
MRNVECGIRFFRVRNRIKFVSNRIAVGERFHIPHSAFRILKT